MFQLLIVLIVIVIILFILRSRAKSQYNNYGNFYRNLILIVIIGGIIFFLATTGKFIIPQLLNLVKVGLPFLTKLIGIWWNIFDFNVYPNPYNEYMNIELGRSWDGEVNLSLYDMFGRVYKSKNIMNSNNNFTHRIDISDNEIGILILKINKKEKVFIKKVFRK